MTITVNGQGTTTPAPGEHNYNRGQNVNITAIPSPGWLFTGWTGSTVEDPASASTTVRMTVDKEITANFVLGIDETPPIISGAAAGDITKDSADITWTTNEPSTSQVDYSASPGQLTPLDANLVTSHLVHLSGLTPATTYTYLVMSQDASGNLTTSGPYTFTTAGQPAAFEVSDLDIALTPSGSGYNIEFSFLLKNVGDLPGSYDAALKIDGAEADSHTVELEGGASQTVVCTAASTTGSHTAEISGASLEFTISPPPDGDGDGGEPAPAPVNWGLIGGIAGGVILLFIIILLIIARTHYIVLFVRK